MDPAGHIETGERQLEHAIPWSSIPAAPHDDWPATWTPSALAERSAARVAKQPAFAKMAALTQLLRANRDDTRLSLARAAWEAHRKQQRAALDAASPDLKSGPPKLVIKSIDDPALPPPGPNGHKDDRLASAGATASPAIRGSRSASTSSATWPSRPRRLAAR